MSDSLSGKNIGRITKSAGSSPVRSVTSWKKLRDLDKKCSEVNKKLYYWKRLQQWGMILRNPPKSHVYHQLVKKYQKLDEKRKNIRIEMKSKNIVNFKVTTHTKRYVDARLQDSWNQMGQIERVRPSDAYFEKGYMRGVFTDFKKLKKLLETKGDIYGLCEAKYDYIEVSPIQLNSFHGDVVFETDGETLMKSTWFKYNDDDHSWNQIPTPECFLYQY